MSSKKNISIIVLFSIGLLALLFYLGRRAETSDINVLAILPLTGPAATFGEDEKLGIQLALKKAGTTPVKVKFVDSQGKPDVAISALQQSYAVDGTRVFITSTTSQSLALLPAIKDKDEDTLTFVIATLSNITKDYPSAVRIYPSVDEEVRVLGEFAERKQLKRVAALCFQSQAGEDAIRLMKSRIEKFNGQLVFSDTFPITEKDFRPLLLKIKERSPDALFVTGFSNNYADIFRQMLEMQFSIPVMAGVGMPLGEFEKSLPETFLSNVVFPASRFSFDYDSEDVASFRKAVVEAGRVPNYEIAYAFENAMLLIKASESKRNPTGILESLKSLMPYQGITGQIELNANRDALLELTPCRYENKKIVKIND